MLLDFPYYVLSIMLLIDTLALIKKHLSVSLNIIDLLLEIKDIDCFLNHQILEILSSSLNNFVSHFLYVVKKKVEKAFYGLLFIRQQSPATVRAAFVRKAVFMI